MSGWALCRVRQDVLSDIKRTDLGIKKIVRIPPLRYADHH